jgi:hypothetical protein
VNEPVRTLAPEQWHALQLAYDVLCDPMADDADARTGAQHHVGNVVAAVNHASATWRASKRR